MAPVLKIGSCMKEATGVRIPHPPPKDKDMLVICEHCHVVIQAKEAVPWCPRCGGRYLISADDVKARYAYYKRLHEKLEDEKEWIQAGGC